MAFKAVGFFGTDRRPAPRSRWVKPQRALVHLVQGIRPAEAKLRGQPISRHPKNRICTTRKRRRIIRELGHLYALINTCLMQQYGSDSEPVRVLRELEAIELRGRSSSPWVGDDEGREGLYLQLAMYLSRDPQV